jgi:hypothetical protein
MMVCITFSIPMFAEKLPVRFSPGTYTHCNWDKIRLVAEYKPEKGDTGIVFVSTRHYFPEKSEFLDHSLDTTVLHYFSIYFNHNRWVCVPKKNLKQAIHDANPGKDVVVYAEGLGKTFTSALDRATRVTRTYGVTIIMFDWATFNPLLKGGQNFRWTRSNSELASKSFAALIDSIARIKQQEKNVFGHLTLFMHSMGNLLMMHAVKKGFLIESEGLFDNVVLNAACVPQRRHKQWVEKINIQDNLYITRNNHDRNLNGAKLASFFQRQLGERPRGPYALNATYIDFSNVLSLEHNYFLYDDVWREKPQIERIYYNIFHGFDLSLEDKAKFKRCNNNTVEVVRNRTLNKEI